MEEEAKVVETVAEVTVEVTVVAATAEVSLLAGLDYWRHS